MLEVMPCDGSLAEELADAVASAKAAGLHYVSDDRPGITRKRRGKGFAFYGPDGSRITDEETLRRIRALAIPPAYTNVWVSPDARGHIQATARDAKGRKQYRYHPRWREIRDAVKFDRMIAFAEALPQIRAACDRDLALPGLCREKVLATVVKLLEETKIRVGNEEYARKNASFGLTTLLTRHVRVDGSEVRFRFRGKSGKEHEVKLRDRRLAKVVSRCLDIPGQELFTYVDDHGAVHSITSGDVNEYLRALSGGEFTAKDFRTWSGTVLAADDLRRSAPCTKKGMAKKNVVQAIVRVSQRLGNTPSVCKKSYVHPAVLESYLAGTLADVPWDEAAAAPNELQAEERFTLALLRAAAEAMKNAPTLAESLTASITRARRSNDKKSKPKRTRSEPLRRAA